MAELDGRVALVTGGTRGIGYATAVELARRGASVVITGRDGGTADDRAKEIAERTGARVSGTRLDAGDFARADAVVREVVDRYGRLDVLVANAGVMHNAPLGMVTGDQARELFDTNVSGVLAAVQAAGRVMTRRRGGSIVVLASVVGRDGAAGQVAYAASKAAVAGLARSAAKELGRWGIRVNAVAPGIVRTDLVAGVPEPVLDELVRRTPLGRLGTPADVARAICFLAGDDAAFVTGQVLGVDGGLAL
jgi:3-oxoacyl-[acyl-carrier protein] reductase